MDTQPIIQRTMVVAALSILVGFFSASAFAADKVTAPQAMPAGNPSGSASYAVGSVEDSMQACLARIPKDATAGQRMIAEQSCRRDEGDRKPYQASGGR